MAKEKKPAWFKMYAHHTSLMDAMPDAVLGRSMKAAMHYFDTGVTEPLEPLESAVFAALKPFMDEAIRQYEQDVENGKKSAKVRKTKKEGKPPSKCLKQKEKEEEKDKEKEKDKDKEDKEKDKEGEYSIYAAEPHSPSRFIPPDVNIVRDYCIEKGYNIQPERFVNYYTSIGWKIGKNPMKDWKAAVRSWNSKEHKKIIDIPTWQVGVVL